VKEKLQKRFLISFADRRTQKIFFFGPEPVPGRQDFPWRNAGFWEFPFFLGLVLFGFIFLIKTNWLFSLAFFSLPNPPTLVGGIGY
jgi:hypothetical protein